MFASFFISGQQDSVDISVSRDYFLWLRVRGGGRDFIARRGSAKTDEGRASPMRTLDSTDAFISPGWMG